MKNMIETLQAEETRLQAQLAAVRATLTAYSVPTIVAGSLNGVQKVKRSAPKKARPVKKQRKKRVEINEATRSEVIRRKLLPELERPTISQIARDLNIAETSVQRIWKEYRAIPRSTAAVMAT